MSEQQLVTLISSLFAGLTALITLIFTMMERRRNHIHQLHAEEYRKQLAFDLEIAKAYSVMAATKAEELKQTVMDSKKTREIQIAQLGSTLGAAIQSNTDMNEKALDAANNVNVKIQSLGIEIAEQKGAANARATDHMEAKNVTIETTNVDIHTDKAA